MQLEFYDFHSWGCYTVPLAHSLNLSAQNFGSRTDSIFCGVFDGHGPYGHLVARKVRDSLPVKVSSFCKVNANCEDVLKEISINTKPSINLKDPPSASAEEEARPLIEVGETEKQAETFQALKNSFLRAFKVVDRELKTQSRIDCYCSGTTAVTLMKQVWLTKSYIIRVHLDVISQLILVYHSTTGPKYTSWKCWGFQSCNGFKR